MCIPSRRLTYVIMQRPVPVSWPEDSGSASGAAPHGVERPCVHALTSASVRVQRQLSRSSAFALHRRGCGH